MREGKEELSTGLAGLINLQRTGKTAELREKYH